MLLMRLLLILPLIPLCSLAQNRYDIVIDEIMADPAPQTRLPSNEWIGLRNVSANTVNLQNWRIGDANSQSGPIHSFILQHDSYVHICHGSAVAVMHVFGVLN